LQAVTRRAGLTTGAVYSTFGSRGALLAAALMRRTEDIESLPRGVADLEEAVMAYVRGWWAALQAPLGPQLLTLQLDLMRLASTDPQLAEALAAHFDRVLHRLADDLAARGAATVGPPAMQLAQRLLAVLQGLVLQEVAMGSRKSEDEFVALSLAAIGLPRESAPSR
jgi:AcrR family transcriptional regulator